MIADVSGVCSSEAMARALPLVARWWAHGATGPDALQNIDLAARGCLTGLYVDFLPWLITPA